MYFASLGDVTDTIVTMTYFPTRAFELTGPVHVHSAFDCAQLLTTDPAAQLLPPPIAGTELRCRRIMALPALYFPLFMDGAGMPLRAAWLLLYPLLVQDNMLASCAPLIDWFRVALVQHPFANVDGTPVLNNAEPPTQQLTSVQSFRFMTSPRATGPLIRHRLSIPKADLPALFHQQPLPQVPIPPAQGLTDGTNEALRSMATAILRSSEVQLARQAENVPNTTPSGKWRELIDSLLMTCRVPNEELLPPFWHVMARTSKQQGMAVLREQLLAYSQGTTPFCFQIPVVSASLYTDIMNLTFCGNHANDFATGISPFAVADGSDAHRASNLKAAEIQRAMLEGGTNMSFRDWELLGTKIKLAVPTTFLDLINSLGLFGNLLGTLFGDLHPLVDSFRSFHASASTSSVSVLPQTNPTSPPSFANSPGKCFTSPVYPRPFNSSSRRCSPTCSNCLRFQPSLTPPRPALPRSCLALPPRLSRGDPLPPSLLQVLGGVPPNSRALQAEFPSLTHPPNPPWPACSRLESPSRPLLATTPRPTMMTAPRCVSRITYETAAGPTANASRIIASNLMGRRPGFTPSFAVDSQHPQLPAPPSCPYPLDKMAGWLP
jgi:hypothetical protein